MKRPLVRIALAGLALLVAIAIGSRHGMRNYASSKPDPESDNATPETAATAFQAGQFDVAIRALTKLGDSRDAYSNFLLGQAYYEGKGVGVNKAVALRHFLRASELDDVNAPVWAGQIYEAQGDYERSAEMHRLALKRAQHVTSLYALGRFNKANLIRGANRFNAVRYMALAEALALKAGMKQEYLTEFSCLELAQAGVAVRRAQSKEFAPDVLKWVTECVHDNGKSQLTDYVVSGAMEQLAASTNGAIDEQTEPAGLVGTARDPRVMILRPPFAGIVAFASDADAEDINVSMPAHSYLNDYLGLPVASSVFPVSSSGPFRTAFFTDSNRLGHEDVHGVPAFFALARDWHRGRYDHLHAWIDRSRTLMVRPSRKSLRDGLNIDVGPLVKDALGVGERNSQAMRLYFSGTMPEDMLLQFELRDGALLTVNSADLVTAQRIETDEGRSFRVFILSFPASFPQFVLRPGSTTDLRDIARLKASSRACNSACDATLEKIEISGFDRQVAISQSDKLHDLNVYPLGYTSHGGESWAMHGVVSMADAYWERLLAATSAPDAVHVVPSFTMANLPASKGYLDDVQSQLGIQFVRPEVFSLTPPDGLHDWSEPNEVLALSGDKIVFGTTHYRSVPTGKALLSQQQDYFRSQIGRWSELVGPGCLTLDCDISHASLVPALIGASLKRAEDAKGAFSHVWYSHFGAPNSSFAPSEHQPFTNDARRAFERLSEAHYGFTTNGDKSAGPRILVASSSVLLRQRKLQAIVNLGLLRIDRSGDAIAVSGFDPFSGTLFPVAGYEARDLAGLTFEVDDIGAASITAGGIDLPLSRQPRDGGKPGWVSIVDAGTPHTLTFGAPPDGDNTQLPLRQEAGGALRACGIPNGDRTIFNASHFAFANPFRAGDSGSIEITVDIDGPDQSAFNLPGKPKRHVFTTDTNHVAAAEGTATVVHRVTISRASTIVVDLSQPDRFMQSDDRAPSALHANGTIRNVCIGVTPTKGTKRPTFAGPFRFLAPTLSGRNNRDRDWLVGGRIKLPPEMTNSSLRFTSRDGSADVFITAGDGIYFGKLPAPGHYDVAAVSPSCRPQRIGSALIERDSLDVDFTVSGCQVMKGRPSP